jgi:predicted CoA-binding protein
MEGFGRNEMTSGGKPIDNAIRNDRCARQFSRWGHISLQEIDRPVDMVQVFRRSEELPDIARQAVEFGAKVLWGQIGVKNGLAASIAEEAGLKVVMNRCPKIELFRPFWKPRLNQAI